MRARTLNLLLLFGSLCVGLLIVELALRLAGISCPYFTRVDEWTGFSLRPGAAGWQHDEGDAYVQINEFRMRDEDHDPNIAFRDDVVRIAVLGDSYTEARQVDMDDAYWAVMERELANCAELGDRRVEVLNFGVSGFGTTQELLQLQHRIWQFVPHLVILQITTGNDIRNNSWALEKSDQKPYFRTGSGGLTLDLSFRETPFYHSQTSWKSRLLLGAIQHSRVLQVLNRVRIALRERSSNDAQPGASTPEVGEAGLDSQIYRPPQTPEWREAWDITEKVLTMLWTDAAKNDTPLLFLIGTNAIQVDPDPSARQAFLNQLGSGSDLFYPNKRLTDIAKKLFIPVLSLVEPMQRQAEEKQIIFHGFRNSGLSAGHWNEEGHRTAGKLTAAFICNQKVLAL